MAKGDLMQPPPTRIRWRLVVPFVALCLTALSLVAVMYTVIVVDKGVRAYASGESLWSKGRKDAIHALELYLFSGDRRHWDDYLAGLAVPMGDRAARLAMDQADFDYDAAFAGFIAGHNHPADVPSLIRMYRLLGWHPRFASVVAIWVEAETHILALEALGAEIHGRLGGAPLSNEELRVFDAELSRIDAAIGPLETEFVIQLGESARWMQEMLDIIIVVATMVMLLLAIYILAHFVLLR